MNRLVANLLDMTRVEAGALQVQQGVAAAVRRGRRGARCAPRSSCGAIRSRPRSRRTCRSSRSTRSCRAGVRQPARERRQAHAGRHPDRRRRPRAGRRGRWSTSPIAVRAFPPARRSAIFEKFHRAAERTGAGSGSGSRSVAASSRRTADGSGRRTAPAAARSSGSRCPITGAPPQPLQETAPTDEPEPQAHGRPAPLVLLIEDEPQMRRFLRTALAANDYRLVEAETGEGRARPGRGAQPRRHPARPRPARPRRPRRHPRAARVERHADHRALRARPGGRTRSRRSTLGADDYLTKPFGVERAARAHPRRAAPRGDAARRRS